MDDGVLDALVVSANAAMAIVTTSVDGNRGGCLIGFHCQCSIQPRRYALWLSKANRTYRLALRAETFAVHFLREEDRDLAALFGGVTGDDVDKFERCAWSEGPHGVPMLTGCPNMLIVQRLTVLDDGGDHVGFVTEPVEVTSGGSFTPLRLADVHDLDPGHEAGERRHDA